jgi:hypothetical protein
MVLCSLRTEFVRHISGFGSSFGNGATIANSYAYSYCNRNRHTYGYSHSYRYGNCDFHTYTYADTNCNCMRYPSYREWSKSDIVWDRGSVHDLRSDSCG